MKQHLNHVEKPLYQIRATLYQRRTPTLYQRCTMLKIWGRIHNVKTMLIRHWDVGWGFFYILTGRSVDWVDFRVPKCLNFFNNIFNTCSTEIWILKHYLKFLMVATLRWFLNFILPCYLAKDVIREGVFFLIFWNF